MDSSLNVAPMLLNSRVCDTLHGYGGDDVVSRRCEHQFRLCRCRKHEVARRRAKIRSVQDPYPERVLTSRERGAGVVRRTSRRREAFHLRYGWALQAQLESLVA